MPRTVLIIGGGPAGLAAALRLSTQGDAVTLLEQQPRLGGRLLAGGSGPDSLDAIPPVLMGHQTATLSLLHTLGTARHIHFSPALGFAFLLPGGHRARLTRPWLPAPFHTIVSLIAFRGLPLTDRWRLLDVIERSWEEDPALALDLDQHTAEDWLARQGQSERARAEVWAPLAHFLIGEDPSVLSAAVLIRAVTRCFLTSRRHARIAVPAESLRTLLVEPAADRLAAAGAVLRLNTTATHVHVEGARVAGVRLQDGTTLTTDWYIAALPHRHLTALLPERILTHFSYFQQLMHLTDTPVLTVHLRMNGVLPVPSLLLLARRTFHWLVSRRGAADGQTLVSVVATSQRELLERSDLELEELAVGEVAYAYPEARGMKVLEAGIVREPRAFLSLRPGTRIYRPLQQSPFENLYLAGDWTDTGLPATLESAIVSGTRCAEAVTGQT